MDGAKIGEGIGCLAVFAAFGLIAIIYAIVKIVIWAVNHVNIQIQ